MTIIYWIILYLLIIFACYTILGRGPIISLFSLMMVFILAAIWLIILGMDFFGFVILSIYVGGIIVFFLFVILTIPLNYTEKFFNWKHEILFICTVILITLIFLKIVGLLEFFLLMSTSKTFKLYGFFDIKDSLNIFAAILYNFYGFYIILAGIILYFAMIGSVAILSENFKFTKIKKF